MALGRMIPQGRTRPTASTKLTIRLLACIAGSAACGLALGGCAYTNGVALAQQACAHVERSVALYTSSEHGRAPATAAQDRAKALAQLRQALPIAARAAGDSGEWQALMTTLSESSRVPEHLLVHALRRQCRIALAGEPLPPPTT